MSNISTIRFNDSDSDVNNNINNESEVIETNNNENIELTGTVTESSGRKFESNLGRLFRHQEGHSQARTWAVRVLSVLFVFPAVLTALVDLGRGLGFLAANKSEKLAKIFTGKSFSLIDDMSAGCKTVAEKVQNAYKLYTTPKVLTTEELNQKSEKAMKGQVQKMIDGFKALNGGYFHTNSSFSSPTAINGEKQITKAKKELASLVAEHVSRNAVTTENVRAETDALREKLIQLFNEVAKDEIYVGDKMFREGPQPLLADVAFSEFVESCNSTLGSKFIEMAKQEPNVAQSLQLGVDEGFIELPQAKQALEEHAAAAFTQDMQNTGLTQAMRNEETLLETAVNTNLITQDEADGIVAQTHSTEVLATAAAKDVALDATEAVIEEQLSQAANELIETDKLNADEQTAFLAQAKDMALAAQKAAQATLEAEMQVAQEVEAQKSLEAQAEAQKVQNQAQLLERFTDFLSIISQKQTALNEQFELRATLGTQFEEITENLKALNQTKVTIGKKEMNILDADKAYNEKLVKIAEGDSIDARKQQKIEALANEGFDTKTIKLIKKRTKIAASLQGKVSEMATLSEQIKTQHEELARLNAVYHVFARGKKGLDQENKVAVNTLEKQVVDAQKNLDKKHNDLFHLNVLARLRPQTVVVNINPEANLAEVDAIIAADKQAKQVVLVDQPAIEEPTVVVEEEIVQPEVVVEQPKVEEQIIVQTKPRGLKDLFTSVRNQILD